MSTITRRTFISTLAAAVAGATLDPERALWIPGQRAYFDLASGADSTVGVCAIRKGDIFTIAGIFAINPITGRATEHLQQFMATSDISNIKDLNARVIPARMIIP